MLIVKNGEGLGEASGKEFAVVLVKSGERYGLDFCLVNEPGKFSDGSAMVEFWDLEYKHGPVRPGSEVKGQFTGARYAVSVLLEDGGRRGVGLNLAGGVPAWRVDGEAMREVTGWLLGAQDRRDVRVFA